MKKLAALFLAAALLLSVAAGCGDGGSGTGAAGETPASRDGDSAPPSGSGGKEITIGRDYDAPSLDTQNVNVDAAYNILFMVCEGLVRNDDGAVSPGVAETWDVSDDGTVYTFHLRGDAVWSDGSPLTAEDFEYSYKRLLDPDLGLENANLGFLFKNGQAYYLGEADRDDVAVRALDERTLEITFEDANLETLFSLARYPYFPVNRDMVEAHGVAYGSEADKVLTNGPYTISQWLHEDRIIMEKNQTYWNSDAIRLDKVTNIIGLTADTASDMMATGMLDVFTYMDYEVAESLGGQGFTVEPIVKGYQFIQMNGEGSGEDQARFMSNTNFRRAINYVVNRAAITGSIYIGYDPTTRYSAPTMLGVDGLFVDEYPLEGWPTSGDVEKAKACLDQALEELGATVEDIPELSMLCFESQNGLLMFQAVQDMLLDGLGIRSTIDPQPIQQMIAKAMDGEWDLWWGGKNLGALDWASPDSFAVDYDYTEGTKSFTQYRNEDFTALYQRLKAAKTMRERKDLMFEMEQILCDDPPAILVGWTQNWVVHSAGLTGFQMAGEANFIYMDKAV